jgi:hypothetical protein
VGKAKREITRTLLAPNRWHTLDETDANKKAKKQSQNEIARTFADFHGLLQPEFE